MKMRKSYPIFISYRHSDTADKAEHLLSLLEASGYKGRVSFDRENLNGRFDLEILRRLDNCTDFIVILGSATLAHLDENDAGWYKRLASCPVKEFPEVEAEYVAEKCRRRLHAGEEVTEADRHIDFVRLEIARAMLNGKNIIPVVPANTAVYNFDELVLPEDIRLLNRYQAEKYQDSKDFLFKDILPRIMRRLKTRAYSLRLLKWSCAVLLVLLVLGGGSAFLKWRAENKAFAGLRTRADYESFQRQSWFFDRQCTDSIDEFARLMGQSCVPINDAVGTGGNDSVRVDWNENCSLEQLRVMRRIINHMMLVPKGTFMMGTEEEAGLAGTPCKKEVSRDFYLAKFELTEREWNVVMKDSVTGSEMLPMTGISWDDCQNYINRLNHLTGLTFGLPTEVQWEYAAGYPHKEGFRYAGSNCPDDVAVYDVGEPRQVGSKSPCALNLYDLSGNVAEWCMCEEEGSRKKHIRGGSFLSSADEVSIFYVDSATGSESSPMIGMRLMLVK